MLSKRILHKLADIWSGLANSHSLVCGGCVYVHMCLVLSMSSLPTPLCSQQAAGRLNFGSYVRHSLGKYPNHLEFTLSTNLFPPLCHAL